MADLTASSLKGLLSAMKVAPAIYNKIQAWRGRPSSNDRKVLVAYADRLNERRVLSAPFNIEVVESCVSSLDRVAVFTEETLASLEHQGAKAIVASILDAIRTFLDRWASFRTPRAWMRPELGRDQEEFPEFFKDLGELRGRVKILFGAMQLLEPKAVAPTLEGTSSNGS